MRSLRNLRWWQGRASFEEIMEEVNRYDQIRALGVGASIGRKPIKQDDAEAIEKKIRKIQ